MKKTVLFFILLSTLKGFSQLGGTRAYRFLDVPMTARAAGVGGSALAIWDNDLNLIYSNPALLNPSMSKQLTLNYSNYVGDLNFGYLAYAPNLKADGGVFAASLQFYNYGKFEGYDEFGQKTNTFNANDYSLNLNYAKAMADSTFHVGICLKTIISQYESFTSMGNAIDFGITYRGKKGLVASIVAKNVGYMWKDYTAGGKTEALPVNLQLGISYKVSKAPFRLFVVYDNALRRNLKYINPADTIDNNPFATDNNKTDSTGWQKFIRRTGNRTDNFMRHVTFGTEILLSNSFSLRIAYNYRRQKEMALPDRRGVNGLSFGFSFKVKRFGLSYAFTKMAFPGNSHMFGITTKI